jgi:hypothetical protein
MSARDRVSSEITDVRSFLREIEEKCPIAEMFRGQTRDWSLLPSIGRYDIVERGFNDWRVFHEHIVEAFLRLGRPYLSYPKTAAEAWVVAQHHGVPTRLLDTTTNPLKALYFAVSNYNDDSQSGVVWAIEATSYRTELEDDNVEVWKNETCPFYPAQYTPRLTAQEGAFLLCPLPENANPMSAINEISVPGLTLFKIVIPNTYKAAIRRELSILGIKPRLLFPDLDGVARGIRATLDANETIEA